MKIVKPYRLIFEVGVAPAMDLGNNQMIPGQINGHMNVYVHNEGEWKKFSEQGKPIWAPTYSFFSHAQLSEYLKRASELEFIEIE